MGHCTERNWKGGWRDRLWPFVRMLIAFSRGRADSGVLGRKAILGQGYLYRCPSPYDRPYPPDDYNTLAHKWSFHRQSRFGKGDGEMRFRGNRRNRFRRQTLWRGEQTDKSSEIGVIVTGLSLSCNKKHPSPFVTFSVILSQLFGILANYHYLCSHKNKI